jgi:hypothetical protein
MKSARRPSAPVKPAPKKADVFAARPDAPAPVSTTPGRPRLFSPKEFAAAYSAVREERGIYPVSERWVQAACEANPPRLKRLPGLGRILIHESELARMLAALPRVEEPAVA